MDDSTNSTLFDELTKASSPHEVLLVEMKFAAAQRAAQ